VSGNVGWRVGRFLLPIAAVAALFAASGLPAAGATGALSKPNTLRGRVAENGSLIGAREAIAHTGLASSVSPAVALIALQHRDQSGLLSFIAQVSNPKSRLYAHYLTPKQFDAKYAPSRSPRSSPTLAATA